MVSRGVSSPVVLITGASSGFGQALADQLSRQGYSVYGTSRRAGDIQSSFPLVELDLTDESSIHRAVEFVMTKAGRIDVLINNAGVSMGAPLERVTPDEARQLFETNVFGLLGMCQAVLPHMRAQGEGKIVNISSVGGTIGLPYRGIYCTSKAAVEMISETMRMEVKAFGIQVTSILAGDMRTPIKSHWIGNYQPDGDAVYGPSFRHVIEAAGNQVNRGMPPERAARQLERIIRHRRLQKTYALGKPLQRLSLVLRRFLPERWFEWIIMQYSKL